MPGPGEFELIARYFTRPVTDPAVSVGIGDDAAILAPSGPIAVAVDMLVAGVHFPAELAPEAIGHRALAVNLSDLAAVGARPRWATLALSLREADPVWLEAFAGGFFRLAERFGVALVGGDTTRGPLTVTVGIIGDAAATPLLRSGARAGDRIFVSGTLGDSAAGLGVLGAATDASARALSERFSFPEPRVALGQALAGLAHAMIDISDGFVADLGHLCAQSGVGAVVELDALPLSPALRSLHAPAAAEAFALGGGDDYELCFTVAAGDRARLAGIGARLGVLVTEIGEITAATTIVGRRGGRTVALDRTGWTHF